MIPCLLSSEKTISSQGTRGVARNWTVIPMLIPWKIFFFFFLLGKIFRMNILKSAFLFPFLGVTRVLISVLRHVHVCVYLGLIHLSAYLRILSVYRRAWTDPWLRVSQDNAVLGAIADFNLCLQSQATRFWAPTAQSSRIYSKKRISKCWDRISATCFATSGNFCFSGFKI